MGLKVVKCCGCLELRTGCIIIAVIGLILPVIDVALRPSAVGFFRLGVSTFGNACLIVASAGTDRSTKMSSIASWIYIVFVLIHAITVLIGVIIACIALGDIAGSRLPIHEKSELERIMVSVVVISIVWFVLELYFAVVAFSFNKELKSGNDNNDKIQMITENAA